jgi:hypothetical protein
MASTTNSVVPTQIGINPSTREVQLDCHVLQIVTKLQQEGLAVNTGTNPITGGAGTLSSLQVNNNATVSGTSTVGGLQTVGTLQVNNNATVSGTSTVGGLQTVGTLQVNNNSTVSGTETVTNLQVNNGATIGGNLTVTSNTLKNSSGNSISLPSSAGMLSLTSSNVAFSTGTASITAGSAVIGSTTITTGGSVSVALPSSAGTLALTSQLSTLPNYLIATFTGNATTGSTVASRGITYSSSIIPPGTPANYIVYITATGTVATVSTASIVLSITGGGVTTSGPLTVAFPYNGSVSSQPQSASTTVYISVASAGCAITWTPTGLTSISGYVSCTQVL